MAALGFPVLRFDFSGIGDSGGRTDDLSLWATRIAEVKEGMDQLGSAARVDRFVLVGLCSGATISFRTAGRDSRVRGAILINPRFGLQTNDDDLGAQIAWWKALSNIPRHENLSAILQSPLGSFVGTGILPADLEHFGTDLRRIVDRGVRLFYIFGASDPGLDEMHFLLGNDIGELTCCGQVRLDILPQTNHTFSLPFNQERLIKTIENWARPFGPIETALSGEMGSIHRQLPVSQFRALEQVTSLANPEDTLLLVEDPVASEWALRLVPSLRVVKEPKPDVESPCSGTAETFTEAPARWVLTDDTFIQTSNSAGQWDLTWSGGPFRLWQPTVPEWAVLTSIRSRSGRSLRPAGKPFFVFDPSETIIDIAAGTEGVVALMGQVVPGPGQPRFRYPQLHIRTSGGVEESLSLDDAGHVLALLPVRTGLNQFILRTQSGLTADGLESIAPMFAMRDVRIRYSSERPRCHDIAVSLVPVELNGVSWEDHVIGTPGDEANIVFALPKPLFVRSVLLRCSYEQAATAVAKLQLWWYAEDPDKPDKDAGGAERELPTGPGPKNAIVEIGQTINRVAVVPDVEPCAMRIASLTARVLSSAEEVVENVRRVAGTAR
jgi:hypothetical protein